MQNIVVLAGNIGQTPETRTAQSGAKITSFSLATSRPRFSEGRVMRDENGYRVMDTESPASTVSARRSRSIARRT